MDAFALRNHLTDDHGADWADDLDADESNRLHAAVHASTPAALFPVHHDHAWAGAVADPQPPMKTDGDQ